jgi:hypothetical protein
MLVVSQTGYGLGMASYLTQEGHSVQVCIKPDGVRSIEEAFTTGVPDFALFDDAKFVVPAEWVRIRGIRVLGPTKWSNLLDENADYNQQLVKAIGLKAAPAVTGADTVATVCGWFNGNKFISKFIVFNYDTMMPGNVGAPVASAGYIAYFDVGKSKLVNMVLDPVEKFLRKANHRGCFSITLQIDGLGVVECKQVSANSNLPYTNALYENTRKSKGDLLLAMFDPASAPVEALDPYVCGVMLSVYPYPHARPDNPLEVFGLNSANQKHMWQMDISKVDDKSLCGQLSGNAGYITARGKTVQEAQRRVYRTISNLTIEGLQYRNDIGKDVGEKVFKLKEQKLI